MKRIYAELYALNNELIGEYTKRSTNHIVRLLCRRVPRVFPAVRLVHLALA